MRVFLNLISVTCLFWSMAALPVAEDYHYDNDDIGLSQLVPDASSTSKSGSTASGDIISLMNPEERGPGDHIISSNVGRSGIANQSKLWLNATIPYITKIANFVDRYMVYEAMDIIEYWSCVQFVPIVEGINDKKFNDYLLIQSVPYQGCKSSVGNQGGKQILNLESPQCFDKIGTVLHELLHAIGLIDEHRRPERDQYLFVHEYNILDDKKEDFEKYKPEPNNYRVPYDYQSVMHFSEYAFSKNGLKTLEPVVSDVKIGQRDGMTVRDAITVNNMYQCFYSMNTTEHYSDILPLANETNLSRDELNVLYFKRKNIYY